MAVAPRWGTVRLSLAATLVSLGAVLGGGFFAPPPGLPLLVFVPLGLLLAGLVLCLGWPGPKVLEGSATDLTPAILRVALIVGAVMQVLFSAQAPRAQTLLWLLDRPLMLLAVAGVAAWCYVPRCQSWLWPSLILTAVLVRAAQLLSLPNPGIDVFGLLQTGAQALLGGHDPMNTFFARVDPYPYWPAVALLTAPAYALFHDVRWAGAAATLLLPVAAYRLAQGAGPRTARTVALVTLYLPGVIWVLLNSLVESLMLGLVSVAILAAGESRLRRGVQSLCLAALWLTKASALLLAPALGRRVGWKTLAASAGLAAAAAVPFWLWNPEAFLRGPVFFQLALPMRREGLTVAAAMAYLLGRDPPMAPLVLLGAGCALILLARADSTWAGALGAAGGTQVAFFLFNKQAWSNYYFLAGALIWLAAAAALERPSHEPGDALSSHVAGRAGTRSA